MVGAEALTKGVRLFTPGESAVKTSHNFVSSRSCQQKRKQVYCVQVFKGK
jgi:hypothetical protein